MHRFRALSVVVIVILGLLIMWQLQTGIKKEELGLGMVPEAPESGPEKEYSCNCEPETDLTSEAEEAKPSSQSNQGEVQRPAGRIDIVVDTVDRTLTVFSDRKVYRQFPAAVGKPSTPSPPGQWQVVSKGAWSGGFGTRWLGLNMPWGKYGIHGTNKPWQIGDWVSAGCIRLLNDHVELLYDWIPIGTQVVITGNPFGVLRNPRRELGTGERGPDVLVAQKRLRILGFSPGGEDGMYGPSTIDAVKEFQEAHSMRITGIVTDEVYDALGLYLFE